MLEDATGFDKADRYWQRLVAQRAVRLGRQHSETLRSRARCRRAGRLHATAAHDRDVLPRSVAFSAEDAEG